MLIQDSGKVFENPDSGTFLGTIADVVDLGQVASQYGTKTKIRIIWVLNANDSEGKPFRVMRQVNATISSTGPRPSDLYNIVKSVLGVAPPVPFESEELIGKSNLLIIEREEAQNKKVYANIKYIGPLPPGAVPPMVPTDFVRSKDIKSKTVANGAPAVKTVAPASAQSAPTAAANTVASTPTAQPTVQGQANPAPAPQPAAAPPASADVRF